MKLNISIAVIAISVLSGTVEARMYQWVSADSGLTQLSGKPPSWYRSDKIGPRVFVFENGSLVDDTAVVVERRQQIALRMQTFRLADEEGRAQALERVRRQEMLAADARDASDAGEYTDEEMALTQVRTSESSDREAEKEAPTRETMDRLRSVVNTWDLLRTQEARSLLETVAP